MSSGVTIRGAYPGSSTGGKHGWRAHGSCVTSVYLSWSLLWGWEAGVRLRRIDHERSWTYGTGTCPCCLLEFKQDVLRTDLSLMLSVRRVYTRSMWEMWKTGSSLEGSVGSFTNTSFRKMG